MDKLKMHTPDMTQNNMARLRELFPHCVAEARDKDGNITLAVDFDALRQELSANLVEGERERYRLDWPGKKEAMLAANAPIAKTLRPSRNESVDFDTTQNLFIEGDNLDALKLLQESYLGKVKMIYIDPPYNTGNDFIYNDNFAETTEQYLARSNQKDETGRLVANPESKGRFHSDWLSMMYPRLKLARNLLAEDGVILVSMDDSESENLNILLNEIYGEKNFIDTLAVELSTTSGPKTVNAQQGTIVKNVEFVFIYRKSLEFSKVQHTPLLDGIDFYDTHYSVWMNDDGTLSLLSDKMLENNNVRNDIQRYGLLKNGKFSLKDIDKLLIISEHSKNFIFSNLEKIARIDRPPVSAHKIKTDVGCWKSFEVDHRTYFLTTLENGTLQALMPLSLNYRLSDDYKPRFGRTVIRGDLWKGFYQDMGNVTKEGEVAFSNGKKPVRLIKQLAKWAVNDTSGIVLDFFAGSSTTAHAVMQLNAEDGGNRRFIMVQLPEVCDEKSEAAKAGYKTIAEISKERIRRAGTKIKEELAAKQKNASTGQGSLLEQTPAPVRELDTGFRVLKVDSSNMEDVFYTPDAVTYKTLQQAVSNIKYDRSGEDLLFQVLLDWGVDLSLPIRRAKIQGKTVFMVDENALVACFDKGITEELVQELAQLQPLRAVFRDDGFASDAVKINVDQIFRQLSPGTLVKSL